MKAGGRVVDGLNRAMHHLFESHQRLVLLGEDIDDPYGGAFGVTRGLSTAFPERVHSTPISEGAILGAAGGLAMCGDRVIVEVMFGDFITLGFDPIVNFISKSASMYGTPVPMRVVVRSPVGGNRGYGATHSQSLQKHLLGVPNLSLYELSPLHEPGAVLDRALDQGTPAVFFEDKVLYGTPAYTGGTIGGLFAVRPVGDDGNWVMVGVDGDDRPDCVLVAPGGITPRALPAMREALVDQEISCRLLVPSRLFPLDLDPVLSVLAGAERILVVEDGVAGGGWAGEAARLVYERLWGQLRHPVAVVQPYCAVIPAAPHLERQMLVQTSTIYRALTGEAG